MTYTDPIYGTWDDRLTPGFFPPPYNPLNYLTLAENGYLTQTTGWAATFASQALSTSLAGQTSVRTTLGSGPLVNTRIYDASFGLYQIDNQDPAIDGRQTKATESIRSRPARSALVAGAARKMYFAIDHNWNYKMGGTTTIAISAWYLDLAFNGSTDKISLVYDGQSGTATHATTFTLGNTNSWVQAVWTVTNAYFGGRLLTIGNSSFGDFYLTHPDTADLWISEVVVTQAPTTATTYFYLVGPNNAANIQQSLSPKTLSRGGRLQASAEVSATGSYTPNGGSPTGSP